MNPASLCALAVATLGIGLAAASGPQANSPQALLKRYKCDLCHAEREPKAGPAYVDVAARYRGDPHALATLSATVKNGAHARPWHMPPHPEISDADARKMVRYILLLRE